MSDSSTGPDRFQMALMRQKGRAPHEERRGRGQREISHVVGETNDMPKFVRICRLKSYHPTRLAILLERQRIIGTPHDDGSNRAREQKFNGFSPLTSPG